MSRPSFPPASQPTDPTTRSQPEEPLELELEDDAALLDDGWQQDDDAQPEAAPPSKTPPVPSTRGKTSAPPSRPSAPAAPPSRPSAPAAPQASHSPIADTIPPAAPVAPVPHSPIANTIPPASAPVAPVPHSPIANTIPPASAPAAAARKAHTVPPTSSGRKANTVPPRSSPQPPSAHLRLAEISKLPARHGTDQERRMERTVIAAYKIAEIGQQRRRRTWMIGGGITAGVLAVVLVAVLWLRADQHDGEVDHPSAELPTAELPTENAEKKPASSSIPVSNPAGTSRAP